jgi:hypothetical protein
MILKSEIISFYDIEQAIIKRLMEKRRQPKKTQNAKEILRLSEIIGLKYFKHKDGFRISAEYLKFLLKVYENKSNNHASKIIQRFLKALDIKFKDLSVSNCMRNYRKIIHTHLSDYESEDAEYEDAQDISEDVFKTCYKASNGKNATHFI